MAMKIHSLVKFQQPIDRKSTPLICNLQSLVYLDLSSNNLVGMIPSCLGSFSRSLHILRLAGNKLIGVVMEYLGCQYFHYMVAIDLSCNKISGEIPDIMGSLNRLVLLNLSNNMFTGSIPLSLGKLSNLEALDLSTNSLSGEIP
ncbi:hypothetical protein Ahy_A04g017710 [Arachis hypogaea]|uniref:LRR receptor-like serine/threonine-protein kinase n=1 Tax=Arachis hypogaea TaxID=3818 RepID=A0A445DBT4_ARAHY|nr:hypothetical protein Ahy_A04g017710 [Arachis hypogaea]